MAARLRAQLGLLVATLVPVRTRGMCALPGEAAPGRRQQLSTPAPVPMATHALRLLPGDDLLAKVREFASERSIAAGCILTCVGSLSRAELRPAGKRDALMLEGKYEIVSLVGTFSADAHHLHMSISDEACAVLGGHVLQGCIVRTTAEIVMGELGNGVHFSRREDARTGFRELYIDS